MREPNSGSDVPRCTYTWPIANQAVAAAGTFTPAAIACPNAQVGNATVVVTPRAALPASAAGAIPHVNAWVNAAGFVTLNICNPSAAVLVATAADIIFDIQAFPVLP